MVKRSTKTKSKFIPDDIGTSHPPTASRISVVKSYSDPYELPPPQIPTDLYGSIIQHLAAPELARCLRVCTTFHYHAVRMLYYSVVITFDQTRQAGSVQYFHQPGEMSCVYLVDATARRNQEKATIRRRYVRRFVYIKMTG